MKKEFLTGLIAAPFTPMDQEGFLNLDPIQSYADLLMNSGVSGAFICGTTGEGASLSLEEKKAVIDKWVDSSGGKLKIIAHVGGLCQSESAELAEHASKSGADAVAAMAPFFFKPSSAEDLLQFLKPIAAAASGLPFYYYHIPSMTGVNIPVHKILSKAVVTIPSFAGVKYTHSDMMDLQQSIEISNGRFELFFGSDEILMCGLSFGLNSAVGSTYNYMAPIYTELMTAFHNEDIQKAREQQLFSVRVVEILNAHGGPIRAGKTIMEFLGVDCGPCRLPLRNLSKDEKESLRNELTEVGFFERIHSDVMKSQ